MADAAPDSGEDARDMGRDVGHDADASKDTSDSGPETHWYTDFCADYDHQRIRDRVDFHVNQEGDWKLALDRGTNYRPLELPERMADSVSAATFREPETIDRHLAGFIISMPVEPDASWQQLWREPQEKVTAPDGTPVTLSVQDETVSDPFGHPTKRSFAEFDVSSPEERVEFTPNALRTRVMKRLLGLKDSDSVDWPEAQTEYPGSSPVWYTTGIYRSEAGGEAGRLIILGATKTVTIADASPDIFRAISPRAVGPASASVETTCEIRRAHQAPDLDIATFVSHGMSEEVQSTSRETLGATVEELQQAHWVDPRFAMLSMGEGAELPTADIDWVTAPDDVESSFEQVANASVDAPPAPIKRASQWHNRAGSTAARYLFISSRLQPRELTKTEENFLADNRVLAMEPALTDCGSGIFDGKSLYDEHIHKPMSYRRFLFHTCGASHYELAEQLAALHTVPKEERAYRLPGRLAGDSLTIYPDIPLDPSPLVHEGNVWLEPDSDWLNIIGPLRPDWPVDEEVERIGFTYVKWSDTEASP